MELLEPQPLQRAVDDRLDVLRPDFGQPAQIRHELGMHADPVSHRAPAPLAQISDEGADHLLDAGIDIGTVESGDARIQKGFHIRDRRCAIHRAMIPGELPTALDHAGDRMIGAQMRGLDAHGLVSSSLLSAQ